jgi:hypothetical protein
MVMSDRLNEFEQAIEDAIHDGWLVYEDDDEDQGGEVHRDDPV